MSLSADMRAAAVSLLTDYGAAAGIKLTVYRARPASIFPPHAFVDSLSDRVEYVGPSLMQRTPTIDVVVVHGPFDSGEAADQRDAFVDGFVAWAATRFHEGGANTLVGITAIDDLPNFTADWTQQGQPIRPYYATRITLEGYAES